MEAAGVHVHLHDRPVGRTVVEIEHRKLTVIDGETAFVGGQNLDWAGNKAHDATLKVQGHVLQALHRMAVDGWREAGGPALPDPPEPHPISMGPAVIRPL